MIDAGVIQPDPDAAGEPVEEPDAAPEEPPCTVTTINLLGNPTFDSGPGGGWQESSSGNYSLVVDQSEPGISAHSPSFLAWLGGYDSAVDSLVQQVTLPADATNVRVRGQRWIDTFEAAGALPWDVARLDIVSTSGVSLEGLAEWTNQNSTVSWTAFNVPVTGNYQGQTVRLRFRSNIDGSEPTSFLIDSLLLEVTTCQ